MEQNDFHMDIISSP